MVRFGLMLATALAPELTVGWACRQWMNAKDVYAEMTKLYGAYMHVLCWILAYWMRQTKIGP